MFFFFKSIWNCIVQPSEGCTRLWLSLWWWWWWSLWWWSLRWSLWWWSYDDNFMMIIIIAITSRLVAVDSNHFGVELCRWQEFGLRQEIHYRLPRVAPRCSSLFNPSCLLVIIALTFIIVCICIWFYFRVRLISVSKSQASNSPSFPLLSIIILLNHLEMG